MRSHKILRRIGIIFCIVIAAVLLLWLAVFISSRIRMRNDRAFLEEQGYVHLVSAGEYAVNVLSYGNENGTHRIVALAGMGVPDSCITMRRMTAVLEQDNQVIFIDRAGYGISDDTDAEMTAEHVVEAYRTALQNAGIAAPYVLMPHSLGGVYATWWESRYPDEIEALAIIDGTELEQIPEEEMHSSADPVLRMYYWLDRSGLGGTGDLLLKAFLPPKDWLTADEQRAEYALTLTSYDSRAMLSESVQDDRNVNAVWESIVTNDIPKIYISTAYCTEEQIEADGVLTAEQIDRMMRFREEERAELDGLYRSGEITHEMYEKLLPDPPPETAEARRQAALEDMIQETAEYQQHILLPYLEKLGSCELCSLPGDHLIYEQKPAQCGQMIQRFLDGLDG